MKPFKNPEVYLHQNRVERLCRLNWYICALNLTIIAANVFIIYTKGICQ